MPINIVALQRYLPAAVKNILKPYYRKLFPSQLCVMLWVTFRCNYRCSYCPYVTRSDYSKIYKKENEPTSEAWLQALNKLPQANIYIAGGEPFLYSGLPELINGLKKHRILGIVTNATVRKNVYGRIIKNKKINLTLSFHREFVTEDQFLDKIKELRKTGLFHFNVNLVATRENVMMIPKFKKFFADNNVSLRIEPFRDLDVKFEYTPEEKEILSRYLAPDRNSVDIANFNSCMPKECSAGQNYISIMPDGTVFRCVGGSEYFHNPSKKELLDSVGCDPGFFLMGNIFDPNFRLDKSSVYCRLPCTAGCDWDMAKIKWLKNKK